MSFALYLEFAHSLQSFEFTKKEKNFQDKKLISILYFDVFFCAIVSAVVI